MISLEAEKTDPVQPQIERERERESLCLRGVLAIEIEKAGSRTSVQRANVS